MVLLASKVSFRESHLSAQPERARKEANPSSPSERIRLLTLRNRRESVRQVVGSRGTSIPLRSESGKRGQVSRCQRLPVQVSLSLSSCRIRRSLELFSQKFASAMPELPILPTLRKHAEIGLKYSEIEGITHTYGLGHSQIWHGTPQESHTYTLSLQPPHRQIATQARSNAAICTNTLSLPIDH